MKRFLALVVFLVGLSSTPYAYAEGSGLFVGLQGGVGSVTREHSDSLWGLMDYSSKSSGTTFTGGLVAGFKGFVNDYFGMRFYLGVEGGGANVEIDNDTQFGSIAKVSGNLDLLLNTWSSENSSGGFFIGVSYTYYSYGDKFSYPYSHDEENGATGMGLNIGFRSKGDIAGFELGANIPVATKTTVSESSTHKITVKDNVNVFLRITFNTN